MSTTSSSNGHSQHSYTDSKADLVSMEMESGIGKSNASKNSPNLATTKFSAGNNWQRRTKLERLLLASIAVIVVAVIVILAITISKTVEYDTRLNSICLTPGCIKAANAIIQNMDPSVDPCDDFYSYACGGFEKRMRIPDDQVSRSQFLLIDEELELQLRDILESNDTDNASNAFYSARTYYEACMDLDEIERVGLQPLKDRLKSLGGWPVLEDNWNGNSFSWSDTSALFRQNGLSPDFIVDFSVGIDLKNSTSRVITFDQSVLGLSREYLIKGFNSSEVSNYYNYMQKVAVLLGADPQRAAEELKESLLFEIKLANIMLPREMRRNSSKLYFPMTLAEMSTNLSSMIDWTDYTNKLFEGIPISVTPDERVIVRTPQFIRNLTELLATEDKRNVANYMLWRAANSALGLTNKAAREIIAEYVRNQTGRLSSAPRWRTCVGGANSFFGMAIGQVYVKRYFKEDAKAAMVEMVADIRNEFKQILNEITWMDQATKERAQTKLAAIKEYIAYPNELMDNGLLDEFYANITLGAKQHYNNAWVLSLKSTVYYWSQLREPVNKTDWKRQGNPCVVNAYYSPIENAIKFPAGILQGGFFGKDRPQYLNYGGIGWVIGHEITHGFDDQGRQYDHEGNLKNWWDSETQERFLNKTQCIIWQYGNYTAEQVQINLNGINTQGENIADNGGIKEAYRAYNRWASRNGEERILPGLSLNQRQLFWLGAANTWCSKMRSKVLERRIKTGVHSPGQFRVLGPLSNSQEFARDFNCPAGSKMNPVDKCEVW